MGGYAVLIINTHHEQVALNAADLSSVTLKWIKVVWSLYFRYRYRGALHLSPFFALSWVEWFIRTSTAPHLFCCCPLIRPIRHKVAQ